MQKQLNVLRTIYRALSGEFTPASLPNLRAWWRASKLTGLNDGDAVASWPDQISGKIASQGTAGLRPTFRTNLYGGHPAVRFTSASSQFLTIDSPHTQAGDYTFFTFFYEPATANGIYKPVFGHTAGAASVHGRSRLTHYRLNATSIGSTQGNDASAVADRTATGTLAGQVTLNTCFFVARRTSGTVKVTVSRGIGPSDSFSLAGSLTLSEIGRALTTYAGMDLYEAGYYDRALSDSDIEWLWAIYFGSRYSPNNLRVGHQEFSPEEENSAIHGKTGGSTVISFAAWKSAWVARITYAYYILAEDAFESYTEDAALNGLNGGTGWAGAPWVARITYAYYILAEDSFESYTEDAALNGLNGGTGWAGAPWVGR